jgi:hypothetical protein
MAGVTLTRGQFLHYLPSHVRTAWSKALRSGEFKQGRGALRTPGHGGDPDEWCCLGVLGRVLSLPTPTDGAGLLYGTDLRECGIEVPQALDAQLEFSSLNDDEGWTFEQIADYVDGKVEHPIPGYRSA